MSYVYWGITLLLFSSLEVVSKPLMGFVDPFFMTFFRFIIGGLALVPFAKKKIWGKDLLYITLIGCLNSLISMTCLQLSVQYGNASTAATLISANPVFVAILAPFILKETISRKKIFGVTLGLAGILIFGFGMLDGDSLVGILFGVASALSFALYSVLLKKFIPKYGSFSCTAYSSLFSAIIYGMILIFIGNFNIPTLSLSQWGIMLYLGVGVTGIAYFALFEAIKRMGATMGSRVFYLKPVVSTIFAIIFLSESIGALKITGMAIILLSLLF